VTVGCVSCCNISEVVGEYKAPFQEMVGLDPTFEEMRKVVIHDRQKPVSPSYWNNSDVRKEKFVNTVL